MNSLGTVSATASLGGVQVVPGAAVLSSQWTLVSPLTVTAGEETVTAILTVTNTNSLIGASTVAKMMTRKTPTVRARFVLSFAGAAAGPLDAVEIVTTGIFDGADIPGAEAATTSPETVTTGAVVTLARGLALTTQGASVQKVINNSSKYFI